MIIARKNILCRKFGAGGAIFETNRIMSVCRAKYGSFHVIPELQLPMIIMNSCLGPKLHVGKVVLQSI